MSYNNYQTEWLLGAGNLALTGTGVIGRRAVGYQPIRVRAFAVIFTVVGGTGSGVLKLKRRPTPGSATGEVVIATLNYTAAQAVVGKGIFVDGINVQLNPGEELAADVTTALTTTGSGDVIAYFEPSWETPAALTNLTRST
jgi:hypothetical protein